MWGFFFCLFIWHVQKEALFLVLWRVLKNGLLTFIKCLFNIYWDDYAVSHISLTGKEFDFIDFLIGTFFFFAWLESTVLDYDDFITLRTSCKIFASLFISEIDFIWFWSQKHLWSIIITWFFQIQKKKNWQRCFSSETFIEIIQFLIFWYWIFLDFYFFSCYL